jgi:hypothetical protein
VGRPTGPVAAIRVVLPLLTLALGLVAPGRRRPQRATARRRTDRRSLAPGAGRPRPPGSRRHGAAPAASVSAIERGSEMRGFVAFRQRLGHAHEAPLRGPPAPRHRRLPPSAPATLPLPLPQKNVRNVRQRPTSWGPGRATAGRQGRGGRRRTPSPGSPGRRGRPGRGDGRTWGRGRGGRPAQRGAGSGARSWSAGAARRGRGPTSAPAGPRGDARPGRGSLRARVAGVCPGLVGPAVRPHRRPAAVSHSQSSRPLRPGPTRRPASRTSPPGGGGACWFGYGAEPVRVPGTPPVSTIGGTTDARSPPVA